jgi:valyl-tRNA synthetase
VGEGWVQDEDTLDTWFSSGMWTFSTLGWPDNLVNGKKIGDLARFHPTQVLETGYEIITLWVSRMVMMSFFALGEIPFDHVYLHGMILDKDGKKMSKSKGNGTNPLDVIAEYGADAARLSLLTGATPGNDSRYSQEKVEAKRNFINKLWNIARFMIDKVETKEVTAMHWPEAETPADRWILFSLAKTAREVRNALDNYEFSAAADILHDFTWNRLADWYLEFSKFETGNKTTIFSFILRNIILLWHPFIPFVTEAIWEQVNGRPLIIEQWPLEEFFLEGEKIYHGAEDEFMPVISLITAIRNARSEHKIEPGRKLSAKLISGSPAVISSLETISRLKTGLEKIDLIESGEDIPGSITIVSGQETMYLFGAVDQVKENERLQKEKLRLELFITNLNKRLDNQEFSQKAPVAIVQQEKEKLAKAQSELEAIIRQL